MRRIDAARLLRELPETAEKFEKGTLTLSQANQIQRASRELKKTKRESLSTKSKRDLVLQLENKTQKQTEQLLATTLDLPATPAQKQTYHRDQSVTLTVTFTQEQIKILEQVQNMVSHSLANRDWAETFTYLAKKEVARRTVVYKSRARKNCVDAIEISKDTSAPTKEATAPTSSTEEQTILLPTAATAVSATLAATAATTVKSYSAQKHAPAYSFGHSQNLAK